MDGLWDRCTLTVGVVLNWTQLTFDPYTIVEMVLVLINIMFMIMCIDGTACCFH